jgi:hypothetical protein
MSVEENAVEAAVAGQVTLPHDLYVGINVVREHMVEFFHRAQSKRLMSSSETALAIFDCIILERDGSRMGGLTLHDYAILTDRSLITWGRGINKDIVDAFPWQDIEIERFGRRNPLEGVVKFTYLMKPTGAKRKISIRTKEGTSVNGDVETVTPTNGTALYLDLMPAGDVPVCVEMMHYFIRGGETSVEGFKEKFKNDIAHSIQRASRASFLERPFFVDLGNGMLVEAGTYADARAARESRTVERKVNPPAPSSPYRLSGGGNPGSRSMSGGATRPQMVSRPAAPARAAVPPARGSAPLARRINAPEATPGGTSGMSYTMTGDVPTVDSGGALNSGNRNTDTMSGRSSNNDTMRGGGGGGGGAGARRETVSLNTQPYTGPSKLDGGGSGRMTRRTVEEEQQRSADTGGTGAYKPGQPTPPPAPAPTTAAARGETDPDSYARVMMNEGSEVMPPATYISPPELPLPKVNMGYGADENVLDESADKVARELGRPLAVPIALAVPGFLLNPYSISRIARGLWIDPRNLGRNATDLSRTIDALADITEVVTTDPMLRGEAVRRIRANANTAFGNNIIFHYTIWPFLKPLVDLVDSPMRGRPFRRKVAVRNVDDEIAENETMLRRRGSAPMADMGNIPAADPASPPVSGVRVKVSDEPGVRVTVREEPVPNVVQGVAQAAAGAANAVENAGKAVANTVDEVVPPTSGSSEQLNTSGKSPKDPTAGANLDAPPSADPNAPKSKLGDM